MHDAAFVGGLEAERDALRPEALGRALEMVRQLMGDDDLAEEEEASVYADDATHQAVDSPDYLEDSE